LFVGKRRGIQIQLCLCRPGKGGPEKEEKSGGGWERVFVMGNFRLVETRKEGRKKKRKIRGILSGTSREKRVPHAPSMPF